MSVCSCICCLGVFDDILIFGWRLCIVGIVYKPLLLCPAPNALALCHLPLPPLAFLISKCFDRVCRSCSWRFGGELSEGWSTCWAKLRLVCQYNGAWSTLKVCASAVCQVKNGLYLCLRCFLVPPAITAWTFKSYLCPNPLCLFFGVSLYYFEVFKAKTFWRWKPATEGNNY